MVSIDGRPAAMLLAKEVALASGSPQWRHVRARRRLGTGPVGTTATLRLRTAGIERTVTVARRFATQETGPNRPAIERLEDGVYYVDLSRATMPAIDRAMEQLAAAPGVVFDVRDYPNGNHQVLSHLLTQPDTSKAWLAIPRVIRPDHGPLAISSWDTDGWEMPVLAPHIAGRVAFLTGPGAISYAESVMGLVAHYHLGAIVGSATAGTNGNVAQIAEPTGCSSWFTGLRVTNSDGSRFHVLGVQPTIPATQTIAGVAAGRDEVLERALRYVRSGS
ncbi:MAG: S41 family peptidase [Kofleriaceae bacterium]